jgi:two-component system response regulator VanR
MALIKEKLVWLVEDEKDLADCYAEMLEQSGQRVRTFSNPTLALQELEKHGSAPDVIVTDLRMPKMDGLEFIGALRTLQLRAPIVLVSAFLERDELLMASQLGVTGVLEKPVSGEALSAEVTRAYDARSTLGLDAELVACLRARVAALEEGWELREQRLLEMSTLLNRLDPQLFRERFNSKDASELRIKDSVLTTEIERLRDRFAVVWKRSRMSD